MTTIDEFRSSVREWMAENAPAGIRNLPAGGDRTCFGGKKFHFASNDQRLWLERMAQKGWTVPTWPTEYGGAGLTPQEGRVIDEEMQRIKAARPLDNNGVWMLGPALLEFGTHEQKLAHLPRIASGEIRWAQGYSEPAAGSDLANIQTKGVEDGDAFIVNGSKLWSTFAHESDWMFALVRTEPQADKHGGISFVLMDMEDPGLTTNPYSLISGESHFAETHFDNVRVPMGNVIGGRGKGWAVTQALLKHERAMIGSALNAPRGNESLAQHAQRVTGANGLDAGLRDDLIEVELDSWAMNIWLERIRDQGKARQGSPVAPSALKVFGTEIAKRRSEVVLSLDGMAGLEWENPSAISWLNWPMSTIGGGTTEIQLNIIAKRGLGLPGK